jgi:hypothetical protein
MSVASDSKQGTVTAIAVRLSFVLNLKLKYGIKYTYLAVISCSQNLVAFIVRAFETRTMPAFAKTGYFLRKINRFVAVAALIHC